LSCGRDQGQLGRIWKKGNSSENKIKSAYSLRLYCYA
jgi:hypothetical protein